MFWFGTDLLDDKIKEALKEIPVNGLDGEDIIGMGSSVYLFFIIVGFVIFIVGGLGCCGAFCSNRVLLVLYAIIVFLLLIAQIAALFDGFKSPFDDALKTSFKKVLNLTYNGDDDDLKNSFNALFQTYECCGAENYKDMPKNSLPEACCHDTIPGGNCTKSTIDVNTVGCITKLKDKIEKYNNVLTSMVLLVQLPPGIVS